MTRLYIIGEGQTETTFADDVLKPHLSAFGVYIAGTMRVATSKEEDAPTGAV